MGLFRRATEALRSGLTKTRTALTGAFGALAGRKIDEEALQTIEGSLLRADVGPALSTSLVESLRTAWRQGSVTTIAPKRRPPQGIARIIGHQYDAFITEYALESTIRCRCFTTIQQRWNA